jgi:hypothetical protein
MPNFLTPIASQVLTTTAASVTFSAIPGTFTDLMLKTSIRNDDTSSGYAAFRFNGDTASNYSNTRLQGNGSTVVSVRQSAVTLLAYHQVDTSGDTANTFASGELYIPSYTASQNKQVSYFSAAESNAASILMASVAGLWRDTSAITSLTILNISTFVFVAGSRFDLYGILKA